MQNKKTTVAGYVVLAGAALTVVGIALQGGDVGSAFVQVLLPALTGAGLIAASDGGH
jgi:hypothetical protein